MTIIFLLQQEVLQSDVDLHGAPSLNFFFFGGALYVEVDLVVVYLSVDFLYVLDFSYVLGLVTLE
jgi:hypothetical protein